MKSIKFANLVVVTLALAVAVSGCKKRPTPLTLLPGTKAGPIESPGPNPAIAGGGRAPVTDTNPSTSPLPSDSNANRDANKANKEGGIPFGPGHENWIPNAEIFKTDTVYFDFDSSAIKTGEKSKLAHVSDYLKSHANTALRVEGHCDERGTEEYNRALGERRALALREALVAEGVDSTRIDTISFGKDRPAEQGHDEPAWSKNRRGEFILLTPPASP